jgi:hypothetical protein
MTLGEHSNDDQHCMLKFGSWVYDKDVLDLETFDDEVRMINNVTFLSVIYYIKSRTFIYMDYSICVEEGLGRGLPSNKTIRN